MRRSLTIGLLLVALSLVLVGGPSAFLSPSTEDVAPETSEDPEVELVTFEGSESAIWAYMSPSKTHKKHSPINVFVRGDSDEVVRLLQEDADGDWQELEEDEQDADADTYAVFGGNETNETDEANGTNGTNGTNGPNETNGPNGTDEGNESNETANKTNETANETGLEAINRQIATTTNWGETAGGTRYAWIDPGPDEPAYWTTETVQLDDGTYYGQRTHIRVYASPNPDDQWVAMQAHSEHFDWFTLRHRVDGVENAQLEVERELMALPQVDPKEDVVRQNVDNAGPSDADGWATKVNLMGLFVLPVFGLAAGREIVERTPQPLEDRITEVDKRRLAAAYDRIEVRHPILAGAIVALFLGVRVAGIALEQWATFLTMHNIAAILYPVIALGIPIATYLIARGLESRLDAAVAASISLAAAMWIDYGMVGVSSLPIDVVLQRMLVIVAIGLIAGGAARRATRDRVLNDMLLVGVAMWGLVLVGTLLGYF
ncbi:hypothetical protein [Natronosalvus rutilus]|uniref:Uncharacterized protein n=1 Tax=Natronosalvus rutilus TaxID=2953753 RepID=A0A9E7N934_9EURY|nr:hypothetical protein [Natronosalvus rutilus]UTF53700.1 hypothetical protein NGM29_18365 [Natronosalvus rutilus]